MRVERKFTIDELAERLALSRSTIYYWVRDLPIPGRGPGGVWPEAARRKGTRAMQRKYRLLREEAYREGLREYDELAADPTFRDFVCLYIAEGYKRDRNRRRTRQLRSGGHASRDSMDPSPDGQGACCSRSSTTLTRIFDELRAFWGGTLGIDPSSIRLQRKSNSNQLTGRSWRSRHGVLSVCVDDTLFRARLQAWMDRLRSEWR